MRSFDLTLAIESFPFILKGLQYTLFVAVISMAIALVFGFILALGRMSKQAYVRIPCMLFISFNRGVPILLLLFLLYAALPEFGFQLSAVAAAIVGFSLNTSAYVAEVNRSALAAVDRGQHEAAASLGLSKAKAMQHIILPQAVRIALPPLSNIFLSLVKMTSIASTIALPELMYQARIVGGREFNYFTVLIVAALIYWGICSLLALLQRYLEKRFNRYIET
ncbi:MULTISPECIES: amino acid ABC transporter permease [Shouchella]|uniref:amino acid ABC transporter permease n=1 Tax=Shouchella TaxID=2893057 RepID=UPI000BA7CDB0|nr:MULTISPECIES: amino acid ABC transporter permease [Shouchella]MCM3381368.1 amino acid ABC transporter permease [Shouchella rhizosphaerae]MEB5482019.1 amino acid ABC transporter permease [Shouchella clausii]MED4158593.1 amino acid ABC transporter permease [Shouchella clausii]MED4177456.1 amino acid ABC transporter permease [Shouchella clausii]PAD13529.1 cysteine ABC transporter permease [Shouchella clausii]